MSVEIYLPFPHFTLTSLNLRGPRYEKGPNRFADDDTKVGPRKNFCAEWAHEKCSLSSA